MRTFIELSTLTDGSPWGRDVVFGCVGTAGDYYTPIDHADKLDWYWRAITTPDDIEAKRRFHDQYFLPRNGLLVVDDLLSVAAGNLLIARCLTLCRMWSLAGGQALWLDKGKLRDVSGSNSEFLAKCAEEAFANV
jgi:hypothetical protein